MTEKYTIIVVIAKLRASEFFSPFSASESWSDEDIKWCTLGNRESRVPQRWGLSGRA